VAAIADRDTRIRLISKAVNEGLGAGLNTGIEHSRASYVSLLDADDLWMPDYLATTGAALDTAPDAGFACTDAWGMDGRTRRIRRKLGMAPYDPPADPPEDPTSGCASWPRVTARCGPAGSTPSGGSARTRCP
jgi:GT2 family glycosyltransferase